MSSIFHFYLVNPEPISRNTFTILTSNNLAANKPDTNVYNSDDDEDDEIRSISTIIEDSGDEGNMRSIELTIKPDEGMILLVGLIPETG